MFAICPEGGLNNFSRNIRTATKTPSTALLPTAPTFQAMSWPAAFSNKNIWRPDWPSYQWQALKKQLFLKKTFIRRFITFYNYLSVLNSTMALYKPVTAAGMYFITFTCYRWLSLIPLVDGYDLFINGLMFSLPKPIQ